MINPSPIDLHAAAHCARLIFESMDTSVLAKEDRSHVDPLAHSSPGQNRPFLSLNRLCTNNRFCTIKERAAQKMKPQDILIVALVLQCSEMRGQVVLPASLIEIARQKLADNGGILISEKPDGSIVVGLTRKIHSLPSSSL